MTPEACCRPAFPTKRQQRPAHRCELCGNPIERPPACTGCLEATLEQGINHERYHAH